MAGVYKTLQVKEIIDEANDFKTFVFEDGHGINYKSGQYITLVRFIGNKEVRRSYSITSSPALAEPLSIGVKRIDNGIVSRYLIDSVKPGDELLSIGNGGFFVLPDDVNNYKQYVFFAAGSGITPIYSLIKTALYAQPGIKVLLIYSNSARDKSVYLEPLQKLQENFPGRFHLEALFSNTAQLIKARLHRELILEFLTKWGVSDKGKIIAYICGPENYMRLCTYAMEEIGLPPAHIKKELFVTNTFTPAIGTPPDKDTHQVFIKMANAGVQLTVSYPDSILKAAKKAGVILPYSCETGRCGSCAAKCIKGEVWHSYNEVLTDVELQKGIILTCVAHPIHGDVELDIS